MLWEIRVSRRGHLGLDGIPGLNSMEASECCYSFSLLSTPTTASVSYLETSRMLGFSGLFLAGPSHSTVMGGCGRGRKGLRIIIFGPSLLLVNSSAFVASGTKEIGVSTGAVANVLFSS